MEWGPGCEQTIQAQGWIAKFGCKGDRFGAVWYRQQNMGGVKRPGFCSQFCCCLTFVFLSLSPVLSKTGVMALPHLLTDLWMNGVLEQLSIVINLFRYRKGPKPWHSPLGSDLDLAPHASQSWGSVFRHGRSVSCPSLKVKSATFVLSLPHGNSD